MRLVLEEMSSWMSDSSFQRVEWINELTAHEALAQDRAGHRGNGQDRSTAAGCQYAHLFVESKADISPKIVGVRFYQTESSVRLDVELRWTGDPVISLKVPPPPVPVTIEVAEMRISAVLRIELLDFTSAFPCFKTISVTCMKKPVVDFSRKLASVDLMNGAHHHPRHGHDGMSVPQENHWSHGSRRRKHVGREHDPRGCAVRTSNMRVGSL
jgi:hypothetical protein